MGRGARWVTVHGVTKSLSNWHLHFASFSSRGSTLASEHRLASPPNSPPVTQPPTPGHHFDPARLPLKDCPSVLCLSSSTSPRGSPSLGQMVTPPEPPSGSHEIVGVRA